MALQPVHAPQPLLLVPPLLPPLVLRTENGFFGAKRPAIGTFGDCDSCTRFEEPPFPPGEEQPGRYVKHQLHEAVDLEGEAGDCVFAAYTGRVVEVESSPDGVRGDVTIDHHPSGTGLVSRYLHLEGGSIRADTADAPYSIPMYEPSTEHERGLASVFTKALELGRAVEVEYRDSVFFGPHRVPVSVRLA